MEANCGWHTISDALPAAELSKCCTPEHSGREKASYQRCAVFPSVVCCPRGVLIPYILLHNPQASGILCLYLQDEHLEVRPLAAAPQQWRCPSWLALPPGPPHAARASLLDNQAAPDSLAARQLTKQATTSSGSSPPSTPSSGAKLAKVPITPQHQDAATQGSIQLADALGAGHSPAHTSSVHGQASQQQRPEMSGPSTRASCTTTADTSAEEEGDSATGTDSCVSDSSASSESSSEEGSTESPARPAMQEVRYALVEGSDSPLYARTPTDRARAGEDLVRLGLASSSLATQQVLQSLLHLSRDATLALMHVIESAADIGCKCSHAWLLCSLQCLPEALLHSVCSLGLTLSS